MPINDSCLNEVRALCLAITLAVTGAPTAFAEESAKARHDARPPVQRDVTALPAPVQDMRVSILRAASSGNLEEMRYVLERNEIMPVLSAGEKVDKPLKHWRDISGDGAGLEIMAVLIEILTSGYVVAKQPDTEMYVWPHFAARGVTDLTPPEKVELFRLVSPKEAERMAEDGYDHYRLGIGADGTWHFFYEGG
ncbi:hypothetical protein [Dichotomicrobium thermohalophilum]|uniref:Uncharacterized protein n=1 Tax=Dichotomicrobium thermohalophilum TaxID=933063 RepID=A0A397PEI7_9HYPH|nr:hypothetical protein [Dichotomicrobium thermohalophilum]RIA47368.1 hypothetical protein BXY53_2446 [Dichotomicrobium thermohalophilum]